MKGRLLKTFVAVLFALVFSQLPSFAQQYHQRLAGRLDLALQREAEITADARSMSLPVKAYIQRFLDSPDHALEGRRMTDSLMLAQRLTRQEEALRQATPIAAPLLLVAQYDGELTGDVLRLYRPGLPLGLAGLAYALFGALFGFLGLAGTVWCLNAGCRGIRSSETAQ